MWNWNTKYTDAMRRVLVARERIARRNPFFASLLFNARLEESDRRPAIWTNGINIFFNPEYVKENDQYIEGDILEVIMHLALAHVPRRKSRDKDKWNQATDFSVRPLVHQYFPQHPELMKGDGLYPNKAAEEIYELLEEQESKKGGGGKGGGKGQSDGENGANQPGGMEDPSPEDQEEADQAAKDWSRAVANASDKAKKAGNMPANIQRLVEELLPVEKLNWRDIIRDMSRDAKSRESRSWTRVNRRRQDPIMPGYADDNIYNLLLVFDVSGSVSDDMLKAMKTEASAVLDENIINQATLIAVDTEPKSISVVTNSQGVIEWKPRGGGGTHFESLMKLVNEEYAGSVGMIFFTDLETGSFGKEPPFPVVFVNFAAHNKLRAPFGRTVDY
jgi:predicted metal-dependent peptidase